MSKGSKQALTVLIVTHVTQVEKSKVVFAAFAQHCIQSTVTHLTHVKRVEMRCENSTLYTGLSPLQGGKTI